VYIIGQMNPALLSVELRAVFPVHYFVLYLANWFPVAVVVLITLFIIQRESLAFMHLFGQVNSCFVDFNIELT